MSPAIPIEVCVDCAMWHANGEVPDVGEVQAAAFLEDIKRNTEGFHVAIGDPAGFSWQSCDGCGSALGGDRWEAYLLS